MLVEVVVAGDGLVGADVGELATRKGMVLGPELLALAASRVLILWLEMGSIILADGGLSSRAACWLFPVAIILALGPPRAPGSVFGFLVVVVVVFGTLRVVVTAGLG